MGLGRAWRQTSAASRRGSGGGILDVNTVAAQRFRTRGWEEDDWLRR